MKEIEIAVYEYQKICELKFSGATPKNYASHVLKFLNFYGGTNPENVDVSDYNISIRHLSFSYRNVSLNAIKAYFKYCLEKEIYGISNIRPPRQYKKQAI